MDLDFMAMVSGWVESCIVEDSDPLHKQTVSQTFVGRHRAWLNDQSATRHVDVMRPNLAPADVAAKALPKALVLDVVAQLGAHGITADQVPAKIEGIAFGTDVTFDGVLEHTLFVANDNDFVPGVAGPNQFFVFGLSDVDFAAVNATFQAQAITVPEPASMTLLVGGLLLLGAGARRRG